MADFSSLESLRLHVYTTRMKGIPGGARKLYSPGHAAQVRQHVCSLTEKKLLEAAEAKPFDQQSVISAPAKALKLKAMDSSALVWQVQISNEWPDWENDRIKLAGWRYPSFPKNGPVLFCHDSSTLPVGQSSMPWKSGSTLMANVTFPEPGISAVSDQVRGMIAAGVLRGASVGFIPGSFKFTSDPQRPMGIDFENGHTLTEWSLCAVPANASCLVVGPVPGTKALANSVSTTREQRIAEAAQFRRQAYSVKK